MCNRGRTSRRGQDPSLFNRVASAAQVGCAREMVSSVQSREHQAQETKRVPSSESTTSSSWTAERRTTINSSSIFDAVS